MRTTRAENKKLSISHRIKFQQREKAAYAIMRRKGLSINQIAQFFGRSTSVVYRALKRVLRLHRFDLRKLPHATRMKLSSFKGAVLEKLRSHWEAFVLGEEGEPP